MSRLRRSKKGDFSLSPEKDDVVIIDRGIEFFFRMLQFWFQPTKSASEGSNVCERYKDYDKCCKVRLFIGMVEIEFHTYGRGGVS